MSVEKCLEICYRNNFEYAGLQYSYQCYCGNTYGRFGEAKSSIECNSRCKLNPKQTCGGAWHNSVYKIQTSLHNLQINQKYIGNY
jgi:hypothetical protein